MDDEHGSILQTSRLLDSVPAVAVNENEEKATSYGLEENSLIFPRNNGANVQHDQTIDILPQFGRLEQQPPLNWSSICSVSSYAQYFNVDTDVVINRLLCSLYPLHGDFFSKIDANPDLYGLVWVSTSLLFMLGSLGNCATYLLQKHANHSHAKWAFDVGYVKTAACSAYGYAILVPLSFYFFLKYLGANASLVRLLCM